MVWLAFEMRAFTRLRVLVALQPAAADATAEGQTDDPTVEPAMTQPPTDPPPPGRASRPRAAAGLRGGRGLAGRSRYLLTGPLVYGGLGWLLGPLGRHRASCCPWGSWAAWRCRCT